jgi:hypothetical protein
LSWHRVCLGLDLVLGLGLEMGLMGRLGGFRRCRHEAAAGELLLNP